MFVAERPGPEGRAGAEDQRAALGAIERQGVRRDTRGDSVALVDQDAVPGQRRFGQLDEAGGTHAVVGRDVPLVADDARRDVELAAVGGGGVAPDAQAAVVRRHVEGAAELAGAVGAEQLAGELVLGAVAGRVEAGDRVHVLRVAAAGQRVAVEAGVHPRPGPDIARIEVVIVLRAGVGIGDRERLLVADERAVGRAVGAVGDIPAGLPVDFVAAPEEQVHAGIAGFLDIRALVARPVFVVADRDERLVVLEVVGPEPVGVDARDVGDVVSLLLEPVDRRIVGAEQIVLRARSRAGAVAVMKGRL